MQAAQRVYVRAADGSTTRLEEGDVVPEDVPAENLAALVAHGLLVEPAAPAPAPKGTPAKPGKPIDTVAVPGLDHKVT